MCRKPYLLVVAVLLIAAAPARAQSANGVYEPFPDQASNQRAQRFVERLAGREPALQGVTARDLRDGLWLTSTRGSTAGSASPSTRADGSSGEDPSLGWIVEVALVLAALSVPVLLALGGPSRRRVAIGLAVCVAVAAGLVVIARPGGTGKARASAAAGRVPRDFFGTVSEDAFAGSPAYRSRTMAQQARAGVGILRQRVDWAEFERRPGRYDLRRLDAFVAALAQHRLRLLPVLIGAPRFRSSRPARGGRAHAFYPPRDPAALGAFAGVLVRRYGPEGTLWRERPQLPRVPVRSWQVWNEPNIPVYWPAGPNPAAYTRLLRATAGAIRRLDPSAEVVSAGLPQSRLGIPFARYLRGMYAAGARGAFDTLAIHPFSRNERAAVTAVGRARTLMDENGDSSRIWVTELGWASSGPPSPFTVTKLRQAQLIARSLRALVARQAGLRLRGVVYFNWRDLGRPPGAQDYFALHSGLVDRQGAPKPALRAFRRAAAVAR